MWISNELVGQMSTCKRFVPCWPRSVNAPLRADDGRSFAKYTKLQHVDYLLTNAHTVHRIFVLPTIHLSCYLSYFNEIQVQINGGCPTFVELNHWLKMAWCVMSSMVSRHGPISKRFRVIWRATSAVLRCFCGGSAPPIDITSKVIPVQYTMVTVHTLYTHYSLAQ